jgi:tetratricopeptide (TPR) repeat protein
VEESVMHESEMSEREERELPGDADDSMEWLEELAGDTGALWEDPPIEEPAMSRKSAGEPASESSPDWMEAESEPIEQESEPIPEWLIPHLETTELPDSDEESASPTIESEQDTMVSAKIPAIPDSDDGGNIEEAAEGQFADDLSWLDRIASGEGKAIEESPTMRWEDSDAEPDVTPEPGVSAADQAAEVPQDADEAMAWLEQLATRQGAPPEELTMPDAQPTAEISEVDEAAEAVNFTFIPEDPDEAVAWLEQLAAQQGAPDEELTTIQEEAYDLVEETAPTVDDELDSAMEELADVAMPEDSDEALAWLGELADIDGADAEIELLESEAAVVEEAATPAVEHDVVAARAEAEILFAQQQTAEVAEEPHSQDLEVSQSEELEVEVFDFDRAAETSFEVTDEIDVTDGVPSEDVEERVGSVISGETGGDEVAAKADEDLDWLDSLDEEDAVSWLESESIASEVDAMEDEGDGGAIADEVDAKIEVSASAVEASGMAAEAGEETPLDAAEAPNVERLERARSAVEDGDWTAVADEYEALLESGEGLPYLISDLETSVEAHEQQLILKRLLGDAYVRNGQLEQAVDIYRQALDQL